MVILAIVGSVNIDEGQAAGIIRGEIRHRILEGVRLEAVVSGGAGGVDTLAENIAMDEFGIPAIVCKPAEQRWAYFKPRNILIAKIGDELVRISSADSKTYGSGWTADYAEGLGKKVTRYVI